MSQVRILTLCVLVAFAALTGCDVQCVNGAYNSVCYTEGYYYDSRVSGIDYETSLDGEVIMTGVTGENDDPGLFLFVEGATVSLSLGGTALGEVDAKERITPFDLAGVAEEAIGGCDVGASLPDDGSAFRVVHNMAVVLQTLDTDGDPSGTIDISPDVAALFENVSLEFDQPWEDFQTDADLQGVLDAANNGNLFPEARTLRGRVEALRALYQGIGLCP
ncbi:MAG: hypothetical protein WBG86_10650 [Polyangiales bacterium]